MNPFRKRCPACGRGNIRVRPKDNQHRCPSCGFVWWPRRDAAGWLTVAAVVARVVLGGLRRRRRR